MRFSALQRAENSSICPNSTARERRSLFQCSSASRKFLNGDVDLYSICVPRRFSALQRAENSSIIFTRRADIEDYVFQCSSASRKFLNPISGAHLGQQASKFQCSSASRKFLNHSEALGRVRPRPRFSALQRAENSSIIDIRSDAHAKGAVSVLFSEPKIPQCRAGDQGARRLSCFSALQRAENSSISASARCRCALSVCFSALQRAENSSISDAIRAAAAIAGFSALQRAENSSIG